MTDPNSQTDKPEDERRYDPELLMKGFRCDLDQYEMIKRCSDKKDMTEWREWSRENHNVDILLEGADFSHRVMNKVNFMQMNNQVSLKAANFVNANLEESLFMHCNLDNADFEDASLPGALLSCASLRGTNFTLAGVNGQTIIWKPEVNRYSKRSNYTDFTGVSLDTLRIDPATKQLLEYNIRRRNWEQWYVDHRFWRWPIRLFWMISDYGFSAPLVMLVFMMLALAFAVLYSNLACWLSPGVVGNLDVEPHLPLWHYGLLVFLRPIYFSVVTMTTLGFGDMYANAQSIWGHILLTIQVILGYVLLGALITRFAVLFTAGGPAGKFADEEKEDDEKR